MAREHAGVVPGVGREVDRRQALGARRLVQRGAQPGVEDAARIGALAQPLGLDALGAGRRAHALAHALERGLPGRAHVEAQARLARHLVGRSRQGADAADRRHRAGLGQGQLVRGQHRARGGHERVAAARHGRRAGVVGDAAQRAAPALPRGQRGRDAERSGHVDEAADPARRAPRSRRPRAAGTPARRTQASAVTPRRRGEVAQHVALGIGAREDLVDVELAAERARAEDRRAEARALLVDHGADGQRPRRAAGAAGGLDRHEPGHDAERTVERAAVGDRVEMRADGVERARRCRPARPPRGWRPGPATTSSPSAGAVERNQSRAASSPGPQAMRFQPPGSRPISASSANRRR